MIVIAESISNQYIKIKREAFDIVIKAEMYDFNPVAEHLKVASNIDKWYNKVMDCSEYRVIICYFR